MEPTHYQSMMADILDDLHNEAQEKKHADPANSAILTRAIQEIERLRAELKMKCPTESLVTDAPEDVSANYPEQPITASEINIHWKSLTYLQWTDGGNMVRVAGVQEFARKVIERNGELNQSRNLHLEYMLMAEQIIKEFTRGSWRAALWMWPNDRLGLALELASAFAQKCRDDRKLSRG